MSYNLAMLCADFLQAQRLGEMAGKNKMREKYHNERLELVVTMIDSGVDSLR